MLPQTLISQYPVYFLIMIMIKVKHQMKYSRLKCYLKHWYLNITVYYLMKSRSNIQWSTTDSNATSNTDISISCLFPDQIKVKHQMKYSRLKCYLKHWYLNITVYYLMKSRSNIQWSTTDSNATSNTDISISCLFPDQIKVKHPMKYNRLKCYLKHWYLNITVYYLIKSRSNIKWSTTDSNATSNTDISISCLFPDQIKVKHQMKYNRL